MHLARWAYLTTEFQKCHHCGLGRINIKYSSESSRNSFRRKSEWLLWGYVSGDDYESIRMAGECIYIKRIDKITIHINKKWLYSYKIQIPVIILYTRTVTHSFYWAFNWHFVLNLVCCNTLFRVEVLRHWNTTM